MKRTFLTLTLALALSPLAANAVVYNFTVSDTVPWTDTGVDIPSGSQVAITATGMVQYGPFSQQITDANGGDYTGQQFFSTAVYPTTIIVSLIGKFGGTTTIGTGTPLLEGTPGKGPGFVGTSYNQPVFSGGRLFLGFNDQIGAYADNGGAFTISLSVTPIPEPSIVALTAIGAWAFRRRISRG